MYKITFLNPVTKDVRTVQVAPDKVKEVGTLREYIDSRDFLHDYFVSKIRKEDERVMEIEF